MGILVILAGGKSSRMGTDKALLACGGEAFLKRIYMNAAGCFERIIISIDTKEHASKVASLFEGTAKSRAALSASAAKNREAPLEFVTDAYPEKGPIGGILSVFEKTDAPRFAIVSTDVPDADMRTLSELERRLRKAACFLTLDGVKPEPLIAAYSREAYPFLKKSLDEGNYKLGGAIPMDKTEVISKDELSRRIPALSEVDFGKAFMNYNTPGDLKNL